MSNVELITGNEAAAHAVKLVKPQVISAYPITPQTSLSEKLSLYIESGEIKAEYVTVESEHSAMTVLISASTMGARTFTATSANGLLYMHEQLHWAAGSRLPIVMCCVNRGVGAPWSIFNDQQDSFSQRDAGWIQIYCRHNQEILDTVIQAYRIAEALSIPVMVCYDGFILSHTMMPVEIPDESLVQEFLPPYKPAVEISPESPKTVNPVFFPWQRENHEGVLCDGYMEKRYKLQDALLHADEVIRQTCRDFAAAFGRDWGDMTWEYRLDDADVAIVGMGSLAMEATAAADELRKRGINAGALGLRVFRPFPCREAAAALQRARLIIVFEKCVSYGQSGGFSTDLKAALYGTGVTAPLHNYVAGLGGRDVKVRELVEAVEGSCAAAKAGETRNKTVWLNCVTG